MKKVYTFKLVLPGLLLYTLLYLLPTVIGFGYSFTNWNIINFSNPKFIGLDNYITIFLTEANTYLKPVFNTILFAVVTAILKAVFGLALALLLNKGLKTKGILRAVFFMPYVIAPLIAGYVFSSILHPQGILNEILRACNLDFLTHSWLTEMKTALPSVMFAEVWKMVGLNMVIFIAGLQTIPQSYYEAAAIDGANAWKSLTYITLPCLMPSITINAVLNVINGFNAFDLIVALTNGGPGDATAVINTLIYTEYGSGRLGMASALGVVIVIITTLIAVTLQMFMARGKGEGV